MYIFCVWLWNKMHVFLCYVFSFSVFCTFSILINLLLHLASLKHHLYLSVNSRVAFRYGWLVKAAEYWYSWCFNVMINIYLVYSRIRYHPVASFISCWYQQLHKTIRPWYPSDLHFGIWGGKGYDDCKTLLCTQCLWMC